ncbi:mechanosensitive ion channel family protein [Patescibacteria group bacterium]|nr:mechanosensitive ion channel family protein [Patescibacteria group bacterium]
MEFLNNLPWQAVFYNNTLSEYVWALGLFILIAFAFKIIKKRVWVRLEKISKLSKTNLDDKIIELLKSIGASFYLILSLWIVSRTLDLSSIVNDVINTLFIIMIFHQATKFLQLLLKFWVNKSVESESQKNNILPLLSVTMKVVVWVFGILLILSNLGVDVTSLIAGLGIGGIAVALAAQAVLGDIFSSITIYFDKPFEAGDFIILEDGATMGVVEKIGFKTTRIKAIGGEEVVVSNSSLTSQKIHNYKKMEKRRVAVNFGVVYSISQEKMKRIPEIVKKIVDDISDIDFDRVHFKKFADSSLVFELIYFVGTADYYAYMDQNQELHLNIKEQFEKENIEMAFPTQTIHLDK